VRHSLMSRGEDEVLAGHPVHAGVSLTGGVLDGVVGIYQSLVFFTHGSLVLAGAQSHYSGA
jgi:hypothetical protein